MILCISIKIDVNCKRLVSKFYRIILSLFCVYLKKMSNPKTIEKRKKGIKQKEYKFEVIK